MAIISSIVVTNTSDEAQAEARGGTCGEKLIWTLYDDGLLEIEGSGDMYDWSAGNSPWGPYSHLIRSVNIFYGATSIGQNAFYDCIALESVDIPTTVRSIGDYAFYHCTSMQSVEIPSDVESIGDYAFYMCTFLQTLEFRSGSMLESIGEYAFSYCTSLESFTVFSGVSSIGPMAFFNSTSLLEILVDGSNDRFESFDGVLFSEDMKEIIQYPAGKFDIGYSIPSGVTSIGEYAFACSRCLSSVVMSDSVSSIGQYAFYSCKLLGSIEIPASVGSVGVYAFSNCASLESVVFADNITLTSIAGSMFDQCTALTSIEIPSSVTAIEGLAFTWCTSLQSITIPSGVVSIGDDAFCNCTTLESVDFGDHSKLETIGNNVFGSCSSLTTIHISSEVVSLGRYAFYQCISLRSVQFDGISSIGSIGDYAFTNCTALENVDLRECANLTSIGECAFYFCESLRYFGAPSSIGYIGSYAFSYCSALETVEFGSESDLASIESETFSNCTSLHSVVIPSKVSSIGRSAFYNCNALQSADIPSGMSAIGNDAFCQCNSLVLLTVRGPVEAIGDRAFALGTQIDRVTCTVRSSESGFLEPYSNEYTTFIYEPLREIVDSGYCGDSSEWVLYDDGLLTIEGEGRTYDWKWNTGPWHQYRTMILDLEVGEGITYVGDNAFFDLTSLRSMSLPQTLESLGTCSFYGCTSLLSMDMPLGVVSIGEQAFQSCTSLQSIDFRGNIGLESIGGYAFCLCTSLRSVTLPESIAYIGPAAFSGCSLLDRFDGEYPGIVDGVLVACGDTIVSCAAGPGATSATIPFGFRSIGEYAFYCCLSLESITIPSSVLTIGEFAFWDLTFYDADRVTSLSYAELPGYEYRGHDGVLIRVPYHGDMSIDSSSETYQRGESIEFTISFSDVKTVGSLYFALSYDGSQAELVDYQWLIPGIIEDFHDNEGTIVLPGETDLDSEVFRFILRITGDAEELVVTCDAIANPGRFTFNADKTVKLEPKPVDEYTATVFYMCDGEFIKQPDRYTLREAWSFYSNPTDIEGYRQVGGVKVAGNLDGMTMTFDYERIVPAVSLTAYLTYKGSTVSVALIGDGAVPDGKVTLTMSYAEYDTELGLWVAEKATMTCDVVDIGGSSMYILDADISSLEHYDTMFSIVAQYTSADGSIVETSAKVYFTPS